MTTNEIISIMLAIVVLIAVGGSVLDRIIQKKGIGWQLIRFNTICMALPFATMLALNDSLDQATSAILAGALGYAFGKPGEDEKHNSSGTA